MMPIFELGRIVPVNSRVKTWFGLAEPFKSYLGNIKKYIYLSIYIGHFPQSGGVADNTKQ